MLKDKDPDLRSSALEVLKASDASERAPHMGQISEMLKDEDSDLCSSALEVLKTCDASK